LYSFLPIFNIIGAICGYDFIFRSSSLPIVILAAFSLIATVPLFLLKIPLNKIQSVFSALILPLSAINGLSFIIASDWKVTIFFVLICCGCAFALLIKYSHPLALKIISLLFSIVLIMYLLYYSFFDYVFQDFGQNSVVKSISSPQNTYIADVINSDQGACGGDTIVNVRNKNNSIDLFFCEFGKAPIHVYYGEWGEFEHMKISWKDENTLLIDGKEIKISD
jgi:hypothetical protein